MSQIMTPSEEQVRSEFESLKPELEEWGEYVDGVLNDYLKNAFDSSEHVQRNACHRVKGLESYCQKVLLRKPGSPA